MLAGSKKKSPSVKSYERQVKRALSGPQPYAHTILLEQKGKAIGHATFNYYYATAHNCRGLYVQDLFVREEARATGGGKALMDALMQIARDQRCGVLELAVWNLNAKALGFYLKQGGVPVDEDILLKWKVK